MLQEGSLIRIVKSEELEDLAMGDFVGLVGTVMVDLTGEDRKMQGYVIQIDKGVPEHAKDEYNTWFVPKKSVKELKP